VCLTPALIGVVLSVFTRLTNPYRDVAQSQRYLDVIPLAFVVLERKKTAPNGTVYPKNNPALFWGRVEASAINWPN